MANKEYSNPHIRYTVMRNALAQLKASKQAVRKIRAANIELGNHPLSRNKGEQVASEYFKKNSDSWIRAVGWLVGQSYATSRFFYLKELPAQIEAEKAAAVDDEGGNCINVDEIIRRELAEVEPSLSI